MFKIANFQSMIHYSRGFRIAPQILKEAPHIVSPLINRWIRGGEEFGKV